MQQVTIEEFKAKPIQSPERLCCQETLKTRHSLYLEFGVYIGTTLYRLIDMTPGKHWYGFDSFEGLPEDWVVCGKGESPAGKHLVLQGETPVYKRYLKGHMSVNGLPPMPKNVTLVKGWFAESIPTWKQTVGQNERIAFMHIDSDLYSSAKTILIELNDRILSGCIILFDELYPFAVKGANPQDPDCVHFNEQHYSNWKEHEFKALNEWLAETGRRIEVLGSASYGFQAGIKVLI